MADVFIQKSYTNLTVPQARAQIEPLLQQLATKGVKGHTLNYQWTSDSTATLSIWGGLSGTVSINPGFVTISIDLTMISRSEENKQALHTAITDGLTKALTPAPAPAPALPLPPESAPPTAGTPTVSRRRPRQPTQQQRSDRSQLPPGDSVAPAEPLPADDAALVEPLPAENSAAPAQPLPPDDSAAPAEPLPADDAAPVEPLPADDSAAPAQPLPPDDSAAPAEPLPADDAAAPAEPLPAEDSAAPAQPLPPDDTAPADVPQQPAQQQVPQQQVSQQKVPTSGWSKTKTVVVVGSIGAGALLLLGLVLRRRPPMPVP